jgi:hypothetical protein
MILCINDNAPTYNKGEGCKTLFYPSEFPWAREGIYLKFIENLGTRLQNVRHPCQFEVILVYQELM